jgi:hypothetical protein
MSNTQNAGCAFDVVSDGNPFNTNLVNAPFLPGNLPVAVRYAGGCSGIDAETVAKMPAYFEAAHRGLGKIVAFSGGTMNTEDKVVDGKTVRTPVGFTITYVPSLLKALYGAYAISTTPRTEQMTLDPDFGGVVLTSHGDRVDYRQDRAVIMQVDAADIAESDWSKDVIPYLTLLAAWQKQGVKVAVVAFNGGGVTKKEIYWALERGVPVIAVRGSGRQTDAFIEAFEKGEAKVPGAGGDEVAVDTDLVSICSIDDAETFRAALIARGIITETEEGCGCTE